jgi:hypothetical protein
MPDFVFGKGIPQVKLALIARVLAAATEKEQPESLIETRDIFNEAGHVFLNSEIGVAE